jgi:hypothetical protein
MSVVSPPVISGNSWKQNAIQLTYAVPCERGGRLRYPGMWMRGVTPDTFRRHPHRDDLQGQV